MANSRLRADHSDLPGQAEGKPVNAKQSEFRPSNEIFTAPLYFKQSDDVVPYDSYKEPSRHVDLAKETDEVEEKLAKLSLEDVNAMTARRPAKKKVKAKAERDTEDWMFARSRFHEQDAEYGPFTMDAAAHPSGDNAQCKRFCSKKNTFLGTNCKGQTVWCNPPFNRIEQFVKHYQQQKAADASTAGMFVLPQWESSPWWRLVRDWARVRTYPKGTELFTAPAVGQGERRSLGPTRWPVVVLWDPPTTEDTPTDGVDDRVETSYLDDDGDNPDNGAISEEERPTAAEANNVKAARTVSYDPTNRKKLLIVQAQVEGHPARILIDGGAAVDLIDAKFARQHGLPMITGEQLEISLV